MVKINDIRYRTPRTNGTRKLSQVKGIARHHSATDEGNFDSFMRHWKNVRGWGTGGYHEIILRDGSVELCYNPEEITNGVAGLNTTVYNICVVGNGSFTVEQERTFDIRAKLAMKVFGLSVSDVKGHGSFPGSSTTCPGINMNDVRKRLSGDVVEQATNTKSVTPKPSKPVASKNTDSIVDYLNRLKINSGRDNRKKLAVEYGVKNYDLSAAKNTELLNAMRKDKPASKPSTNQTTSIVDYLNSRRINSSFSNRKKLAAQHGIKNYSGTSSQNTALLNKMRSGSVVSKPAPTKKGNQKTGSVVDYLKSVGQSSSFANRQKLASKHGIKKYSGTATQNEQLLNKLRK